MKRHFPLFNSARLYKCFSATTGVTLFVVLQTACTVNTQYPGSNTGSLKVVSKAGQPTSRRTVSSPPSNTSSTNNPSQASSAETFQAITSLANKIAANPNAPNQTGSNSSQQTQPNSNAVGGSLQTTPAVAGEWHGIYTGTIISGPAANRGFPSPIGKSESTQMTLVIDPQSGLISAQNGTGSWTRRILSLNSFGGTAEDDVSFAMRGNQLILSSIETLQGFTIRGQAILNR